MYEEVQISTHLIIPKSDLKGSLRRARQKFTAVSEYSDEGIPTYVEFPEHFGVPLHHYPNWNRLAKTVTDLRMDGSLLQYDFLSKLRPGQKALIERFEKYLSAGKTGFLLEAPPGFGKTVCIIKMMQLLGRSTLVVVPRSNLVDQWKERILEHTSLKASDIGTASGGKAIWKGRSVCVGLVHTLGLDRFGDEFKHNWGCIAFDEVDRSVPPATFAPVVGMFPARFRIGASAIVKRKDGLHTILEDHIAQVKLKGIDEGRMTPKVLIVDFPDSSGYVHPKSPKLNRRGMLLSRLAKNVRRNLVLARYIHLIYKSGRRCLVVSDRTEQLVNLRKLFHKLYGVPFNETGYYCDSITVDGKKVKVSDQHLEFAASACKVIFGTYGKIAIGTDIKDLAGLVYATPQSEVAQTQGRIEREMEGKQQPVVVDIVDSNYKDAVIWAKNRRRFYITKSLLIKEVS